MQTLTLMKPAVPLVPLGPLLPLLPVHRKSTPLYSSHLSRQSTFIGVAHVPATPKFPNLRCSYKPALRQNNPSSRGISLISTTSDGISPVTAKIPRPSKTSLTPRAAKEEPFIPPYPEMTEKPEWWWRSLACLPYMMSLHQMMIYGGSSQYNIHPFFENNEHLAYPFFYAANRLPQWAWMVYLTAAFLGIVRRKEFPHFFRFHLLTGMMLEICQQILYIVTGWFPLGQYYGWMMKPFFRALAFAFIFTVMESIRCALAGMYPDIPFISDAAYIQSTL